jgi:tetratricopeptide (TPR) repeat protein
MSLEQGNLTKALDNFSLSLKCDPRHVEAHYNLGNLYYDAGELRLARLHYEAATQIESGFSLVYFNLALVYHKMGDFRAAYAALERYKELEPNDEEIEAVNQLLKAMQTAGKPRW